MREIILASASPRRKELLSILGLDFKVCPSRACEDKFNEGGAADLVCSVSREKAREVGNREQGLIIGADTVVSLERDILGKPRDAEEALYMLERLAGTTHRVFTGVAVLDPPTAREVVAYEETLVRFRPAKKEELWGYVATGEPLDKAGAYAIQGLGSVFISGIEGCYFNVVGLPLFRLNQILTSFGVSIFSKEVANGGRGGIEADD